MMDRNDRNPKPLVQAEQDQGGYHGKETELPAKKRSDDKNAPNGTNICLGGSQLLLT